MKVKYLLLSLLACAGFAVTSCTEEDPIFGGDELALKVEPSIISVGKDGGSKTIDINAGIEWKAEPKDSWITVSPSSGSGAGKVTVTVAKNDSEDARQTTVAVTAGTAKMNITVKQEAGGVVYGTAEHPYTPSRIYAYLSTLSDGEKTDDIYIEGFIAKIDEQFGTQYGNATFYMTDDGKTEAKMFQVYRALYIGNKKYDNEADKNINVGDKVVVYGKCVNYKGNTPETSSGEAYVVSIEEGTMPVLEMAEKSKAISAGDTTAEFDLSVKNLTAKWTVTPKEAYAWVKDYTKEGTESGKITITVEANTADDAREAKFTVASDGAQSLEFTLTQNGNVLPANIGELIAAIPATATGSSTKAPFEANLKEAAVVTYVNGGTAYIEDATGAVILYNTNHGLKAGDTVKGKISGDCYWYNGAPEILGLGEAYEKGEGEAPAPKEITIPELLANYPANLIRFVVIKGVTVTDAIEDGDRNGKVAVGSDEIAVYAQLKEQGLTLNKDAEGNLTAIVGCYNDNKQLLFWDNAWFEKTGGPVEVPEVYLNEFDPNNKKIEIYNATDAEVDMTGWILTKDNDESTKFVIAATDARAKIAAKGFVVFTCKSDGTADPSFGLSPTKGFIITLKDKDGNVVDNVDNSSAREGGIVTMGETQSWGRETDGAENFVLFDTPTIGASNGTVPPPPAPKNIGELIAAIPTTATGSSSAATISVDFTDPATVTYVNGKNAYIEDATGAVILYMENHGLQAGVTIKGKLDVTAYWYQGMPELISYTASQETVTGTGEIPLTTVTIAELVANYDKYLVHRVKLEGVKVTGGLKDSDRDGEVQQGDAKIAVRAQLSSGLELTEGDEGNLICIPALYSGNKQVYYWDNSWWESTATDVPPTITASDITNVPAEGVTDATTTVTFANNEGWTASVTPDGTVVTAASIDGTTIKYTVAANTATEARDGKITVTLKKDGKDDVTKDIKVSQKGVESSTVEVGTVLWSETWTGGASGAKPEEYSQSGTTVFGGATVTYSSTTPSGGSTTKIYVDNQMDGSTSQENLLLSKSGGTWTITGIPTGKAAKAELSIKVNSKRDPDLTSTTSGIVIGERQVGTESAKPYTYTWAITLPDADTFDLTFTLTNSSNIRIDDVVLKVTELGGSSGGDNGSGIPDYDPITGFTW